MHTMTKLPTDKPAAYAELEASLRALLAGEDDRIANAANLAALLFWSLPQRTQLWFLVWNAVGFVVYLAYSRRNSVLAKGGDA